MSDEWSPRLNLTISEEQFNKLQKLIPWGIKTQIFNIIIDDLINLLEKGNGMAIGAILAGKVKLSIILKEEL